MKDRLLASASALRPPRQSAVEAFSRKRDQLAAMANRQMAQRPDLEKMIGEDNRQMAEDNNRNFARFMEALFTDFTPGVLVETVIWVFLAYRSHGFQTTYWPANLNVWTDLLEKELPEEAFNDIYPFYNWLIINIPAFVKLTDEGVSGPDETTF